MDEEHMHFGRWSRRVIEHDSVVESERTRWLALQIDEVEEVFLRRLTGLTTQMENLTAELHSTRESMSSNTSKIVYVVLTASFTLLASVIAWVITFVVK